jgi:thioredoxin reductase (NADPH)
MPNWDVVIIGGGAAGLGAATTAARAGLSCLVVDRMGGGGELMNLGPLREFGESLTGPDLLARLLEEATNAGAELDIAEVTALTPEPAGWHIATDDQPHTARAVILAIGLAPGTLGIDGEEDFEGRGLSHCAACDGPLFRGEPVVVAGDDRWARLEAQELAAIASPVTLVTQSGVTQSGVTQSGVTQSGVTQSGITQSGVSPGGLDSAGFTVIRGCITALEGAAGLEAVLVQPAGGGPPQRLPAQAVFVQSTRRPALGFVPNPLACDADCRLVTDDSLQCSMPRLFAAGDARAGAPRTLTPAIAEARRAAASARDALATPG